jgi:hypothetical protein
MSLAACGGAPKTVADPARGLIPLTVEDDRLDAIVLEASRAIPETGQNRPLFGGVYVDGRHARRATDVVARASGLQAVTTTRSPKVECRATSSSGRSTPIPCPPQAVAALPPVLSFVEVRATADSAYVGLLESDDRSSKSSCITLLRAGTGWRMLETSVIADAKRCGR